MVLSSWNVSLESTWRWPSHERPSSHPKAIELLFLWRGKGVDKPLLGALTFLVVFFFVVFFSSFSWGPPDSSRRILILGPGIIPYHCWIAPWLLQASSLGWANCIPLMFLIANTLPWHFMAWAWKFVISTYTSLVLNECLQLASMRNVYTHWGF